ncbi:hypothetical protein Tther_00271 [Tepidimonas thermarum]|uniref:Type II secretion system protein GspE N-terminal domain-containing protein n=1 Tax=Tepidimonas thermarum TaxID=335431 RepID=A0A554X8A7_9BURK|nr:hypothetical protein Tther_00271 [Tepidimonas thermarum]
MLVVLMADPLDQRLLEELRFMTQRRIVPVLAAPGTLPAAIARAYEVRPAPASGAAQRAASGAHTRQAARDLVLDLQQVSDIDADARSDVVSESDTPWCA